MKVRDIRKRAKSRYVVIEGFKFLRSSQSKRCRSYEAGCVNCDEWRYYDTYKRFPSWDELRNAMEQTQEALCSHGTIES
jgi:hypothetical protein